jgi:hypothetical protein
MHRDDKGESHPDKDDQNLIPLSDANDLRPTEGGVGDDQPAGEPDR